MWDFIESFKRRVKRNRIGLTNKCSEKKEKRNVMLKTKKEDVDGLSEKNSISKTEKTNQTKLLWMEILPICLSKEYLCLPRKIM